MSLPGLFTLCEEDIPATIPYLRPEAPLIEKTASLVDKTIFSVGICWSGSKENIADAFRSIPLRVFESLAKVDGVRLYALQKGEGREQLLDRASAFPLHDLSAEIDNGPDGFVETAAVLAHLDLVITIDSSLAHLAGALGRPVWTVLSSKPEWRWLRHRADSPWYPTMRLFRSGKGEQWTAVMTRVARALELEVAAKKERR
jgi:hypothetical protein